jgi:hypothetical protein
VIERKSTGIIVYTHKGRSIVVNILIGLVTAKITVSKASGNGV